MGADKNETSNLTPPPPHFLFRSATAEECDYTIFVILLLYVCSFAGLENVANLATDVQTEGAKYLKDLICNKVCRAKKAKSSDPTEVYKHQ